MASITDPLEKLAEEILWQARLARFQLAMKSFNPLQARAPAGGSDGGQWVGGDGAGDGNSISGGGDGAGDGGGSRGADAHLSAIRSAFTAGMAAAESGTHTSDHRDAVREALDAVAKDKTVTNDDLRSIGESLGVTITEKTRQKIIDEIMSEYRSGVGVFRQLRGIHGIF